MEPLIVDLPDEQTVLVPGLPEEILQKLQSQMFWYHQGLFVRWHLGREAHC